MSVRFLEVAHEVGLAVLHRVEESKIRLKLRLDDRPVNPPLKNLIGQIEDVVSTIIGLELFPLLR